MSDYTVPQDWNGYSAAEHALWDQLYARQVALLPGRVAAPFLEGLEVLQLSRSGIPDFAELSARLTEATGWRVVAVPGLVPDAVFYEHLANRRFVAARFLRSPAESEYL